MDMRTLQSPGSPPRGLAMIAGSIMAFSFLAVCAAIAATGVLLFADVFNGFYVPQVFHADEDKYYCTEGGAAKFNVFDPFKSVFVNRIYRLDNGQWNMRQEIKPYLGGASRKSGRRNVAFVPGELLEINGTTIERRVPFDVGDRFAYGAFVGDTLAVLQSRRDDNFAITYFDGAFNKTRAAELGKPSEYEGGYLDFSMLLSDHGKLWLFWENHLQIHYAQVLDNGFGETGTVAGKHSSFDLAASRGRKIIILEPLVTENIKNRSEVFELWEFADGGFEKLGELSVPGDNQPMVRFSEIDGVINAFILDDEPARKELVQGEWRDADMIFPAEAAGCTKKYRARLRHALAAAGALSFFWLLLAPALGVALVDWRFKSDKEGVTWTHLGAAELASLARRAAAFDIDAIACGLVAAGVLAYLIWLIYKMSYDPVMKLEMAALATAAVALLYLIVLPVYFTVLEGLGGKTLGKRIMNIKVIGADGAPAALTSILQRNLLRIIDLLFCFAPGAASMGASELFQRLGDRWGDTIVIKGDIQPPPVSK